jgi:hypothetical protein
VPLNAAEKGFEAEFLVNADFLQEPGKPVQRGGRMRYQAYKTRISIP